MFDGINRFLKDKSFPGLLLLITSIIALVWVNSPFGHYYHEIWELPISIGVGDYMLSQTIHHWINDGLMAIFFFVVGLEIKQEILYGELSEIKKATLPIVAAIGGMVFPAAIYMALNQGEPLNQKGWGVPMATDIAFALGVLTVLGKKVPLALKVFLTALAIADDIGAVFVIALFYSFDISSINILLGIGFLGIMITGNFFGVRNRYFYALLGIGGLWLAFLLSGVHATVAGVLGAFAIPANTKISKERFTHFFSYMKHNFSHEIEKENHMLSKEQLKKVNMVKKACKNVEPPLQALVFMMDPWVKYVILPLFALANAGIIFSSGVDELISNKITLGIILGLFFGKTLGISLFAFIACKLGISQLPKETSWTQIIGVSSIAGIGFTMSIFISNLAFNSDDRINAAKIGVFIGSILSGIIGVIVLNLAKKKG